MHAGELAELKLVSARIDELQERHWHAGKQGKHARALHLAQELHSAQMHRKRLVDRLMAPASRRADGPAVRTTGATRR